MKIKCINNDMNLTHTESKEKPRLTLGKIYDGEKTELGYAVINDEGEEEGFVEERFEKLRDINLEQLGI